MVQKKKKLNRNFSGSTPYLSVAKYQYSRIYNSISLQNDLKKYKYDDGYFHLVSSYVAQLRWSRLDTTGFHSKNRSKWSLKTLKMKWRNTSIYREILHIWAYSCLFLVKIMKYRNVAMQVELLLKNLDIFFFNPSSTFWDQPVKNLQITYKYTDNWRICYFNCMESMVMYVYYF